MPVLFGLIGYPLEKSLSPKLHSAALAYARIQGDYQLFPIKELPEGNLVLTRLIEKVRSGEIAGLNVTIPHKRSIIPYLDGITASARAIGAVNTIYHVNNEAIGDNTDAPGFRKDLMRVNGPYQISAKMDNDRNARALVLGAGGAARAVVYALCQMGFDVVVAGRRIEQAELLVRDFQNLSKEFGFVSRRLSSISIHGENPFHYSSLELNPPICLIVNTTSAGMYPNEAATPWPPGARFPDEAFVYDLVYKPIDTTFLKSAREAGLPTASGLGMLVEQAALSFERWTQIDVPRSIMWKALEIDFGNPQGLNYFPQEKMDNS